MAAEIARQYARVGDAAGRRARRRRTRWRRPQAARAVPAPAEAEELLEIALDARRSATGGRDPRRARAGARGGRPARRRRAATLDEALDLLTDADEIADARAPRRRRAAGRPGRSGRPRAADRARARRARRPARSRVGAAEAARAPDRPSSRPARCAPRASAASTPRRCGSSREQGTEADEARTIDQFAQWPLEELEAFMARVAGWRDPLARLRGLLLLGMSATRHALVGPVAAGRATVRRSSRRWASGSARCRRARMACRLRAALHGSRGGLRRRGSRARRAATRSPSGSRPATRAALARRCWSRDLTLQHVAAGLARDGRAHVRAWRAARGSGAVVRAVVGRAVAAHAFARGGMEERARAVLAAITPGDRRGRSVGLRAGRRGQLRRPRPSGTCARPSSPPPLLECARRCSTAGAGDYYMASSELTVARLERAARAPRRGRAAFERARHAADARGPAPAARDRRPRRRRSRASWRREPGAARAAGRRRRRASRRSG